MKRLNLSISTPVSVIKDNDCNDTDDYPSSDDDYAYGKTNKKIADDNIIVTATPFSMNTLLDNTSSSPKIISSLFFIIQTKARNTYILYTSYLLEDEMEQEILNNSPFHVENNFSNFRICSDIIIKTLPVYITDFIFNDTEENGNYRYSIQAKEVINKELQKPIRFYMTSDIFCSLKYIDNYIFEEDINNYELSMASISARELDIPSEVVTVDKVDRIIAMVPMKHTTTCGIEFVVVSGENKYTLLCTFNLGKKFGRKKFKGMNIDKINDIFLKESDQYLQLFSEFCRFDNIDKDYLIIKGKNKDGINKLFMLDGTVRVELEGMITDY